MVKKFSSILAMAALLSTTATYAHLPSRETQDREAFFQRGTQAAAGAFHRTVSSPLSQEAKWWGDFEKSNKDIHVHIKDVADIDPEAAMWFLLTGGKYGFSNRQGTSEEQALLLSAMQKVAQSFASAGNKREAYEKWVGMEKAHQAGHVHLEMIYQQIDDLKKANESLNLRVGALEVKNSVLEERILGVQKKNSDLEERLSKTEAKNQSLEEKLDAERELRETQLKQHHDKMLQHKDDILKIMEQASLKQQERDREFREEMASLALQSQEKMNANVQLFMIKLGDSEEKSRLFLKEMMEASKKEAREREEQFLARLAKVEQEAREREQAILAVIGKDVERLPHIERLADKSVELGFQNRDLSQETLRTTNPNAFNQYMKSFH